MVLLVDQNRSVVPLRSAKARVFGELWREKNTHAHASCTFPPKLDKTSSFEQARPDKWEATLVNTISSIASHRS